MLCFGENSIIIPICSLHVKFDMWKMANEQCHFTYIWFHVMDFVARRMGSVYFTVSMNMIDSTVRKTNLFNQNVVCRACFWYHPSFERHARYSLFMEKIRCGTFNLTFHWPTQTNHKTVWRKKPKTKKWKIRKFFQVDKLIWSEFGIGLLLCTFLVWFVENTDLPLNESDPKSMLK